MENFRPHGNRDQTQAMNREEAEGSGAEEQRTPREDRGDADDAGTGGRMARGKGFSSPLLGILVRCIQLVLAVSAFVCTLYLIRRIIKLASLSPARR